MKRKLFIFTLLIFTVRFAYSQNYSESELLKQFHSVDCQEMMSWMEKLCSPEFNGRLTGTPGFLSSTEWVAGKFKEWGIKPAGDNNTYFQWFDAPFSVVNDPGRVTLNLSQPDGSIIKKHYSYPDEYYPGMNSGSGEVTSEVVYVGYGVTAPELNYDDYKGIDVKGKIVLMNRDVPYSDPTNPEYKKWVGYCYHQYKLENAVRHGAAGFLYIDGIGANPNISYDPSIIVCGIGTEILNDIFAGSGTTNKVLTDGMIKTLKPASFKTGKIFTLKANTTRHPEGKGCNVTGIIEGNDSILKKEVIIIGGHLDAVGNAGGKVVNGALDNASGIVDILGAARALAGSGIKLKRSVMFLCLGGEENGLLGSKFYVQNPAFSMNNTVTYINLDMVGNGTGIGVGTDSGSKNLLNYFEKADSKYIHRQIGLSAPSGEFYGRPRTDGVIFNSAGYRTMSIWTTNAIKKVYYHIPGDDPDAVTIDIMADVSKLLYLALIDMANDSDLKLSSDKK